MLKKLKDGRNPKDGLAGGANLACCWPGGRAARETGWDWRDVVDELERDELGVDQSQARHESRVSL